MNVVGENISSVTIVEIFIVNQLGKHDFSFDFFYYWVNYLKDRKHFSDQKNSNRFDPILARRDWSCTTMENLSCLNSAVNEII